MRLPATKAISLWQPWASLWLTPSKVCETRHWSTAYRGRLYVHAARRPIRRSELTADLITICERRWGKDFAKILPLGQVIGLVKLVDCVLTETMATPRFTWSDEYACGNFAPGRFAWRRDDSPCAVGPWPYKGRQGLFQIRDDELDRIANRELYIPEAEKLLK